VIASISTLYPQDSCAIVSFSSAAQVVLPPTRMDAAGKRSAGARLRALRPEGSTNLWAGIEAALDVLRNEAGGAAALSCVQVLTDGQPNVDPPNLAGHAASLRDYQARHGSRTAVHTFGFSYHINF
jgi:Mg-chelatase subunit ChlD